MSQDLFNLQDQIVVVTGGLGQLGRQYTRALVEHGAKVAVFDIREAQPMETDSVAYFQVNVANRESLENALAALVRHWGVPHVLINNAAIDSPPNAPSEENGPFETYPEQSWDRVIDVNLKGVFLCCQVIGSAMAEAGRGSIINIASIYGLVSPNQDIYKYRFERDGKPFFKPVAYSVSKSGLLNFTRYLATYWARKGVRVNSLTLAGVFNNQDTAFLEQYHARMPMGRMANEDEYNGAIVFLASKASSYMTGSNMIIDGGWTAW